MLSVVMLNVIILNVMAPWCRGTADWIQTHDLMIGSRMLYQCATAADKKHVVYFVTAVIYGRKSFVKFFLLVCWFSIVFLIFNRQTAKVLLQHKKFQEKVTKEIFT